MKYSENEIEDKILKYVEKRVERRQAVTIEGICSGVGIKKRLLSDVIARWRSERSFDVEQARKEIAAMEGAAQQRC